VGADGHEHPHSFYRDGDDKRITKVEVSPDEPANHGQPDEPTLDFWISHELFSRLQGRRFSRQGQTCWEGYFWYCGPSW